MRSMVIRQEIRLALALAWLLALSLAAGCRPAAPTAAPPPTASPLPSPTAPPAAPQPSATPLPTACAEPGQVETHWLPDPRGDGELPLRVYLPPCYAAQPEARYPVLYLLHGLGYDETQWLDLGLAQTADALIAAGELPPLLIVLPRDPDISLPPDSPFEPFLLEKVLPFVEGRYRVRAAARFRALGGVSRGGGWAVHLGLQHPELFSALGWHSPALFWGDEKRVPSWLAALPPEGDLQVYVDSGHSDVSRPNAEWLEAQLTAYGVPHEWHLFVGYHENAYWQAHLADYLRWYGARLGED